MCWFNFLFSLDFCKLLYPFFGDCCFCSSIGEESLCREIFEQYIAQLKEQEKEHEQKRKEEKVFN
jgi:hypothetical protein